MFRIEHGDPSYPSFVEINVVGQDIELAAGVQDYEMWGSLYLSIEEAQQVYSALRQAILTIVNKENNAQSTAIN